MKNLSMRARLLLSLVPTILCAILVSIQTYYASRQENPELEAALRMVEITSQQEMAMVEMSEALRGYLLDPTRAGEFTRKKEADARYVRLSDELRDLTQDSKAIQELNKVMAEFDVTTLDERENQVASMVQNKDPGALAFYYNQYAEARRFQVENFLKLKELVRDHSNQAIRKLKDRTYYSGLMSIAALWSGLLIGLGMTAAVAFQVTRRTEKLFGLIHQVSDTVAHSSRSIHVKAGELSDAVQRQSAAIQETAASVNEISAMIKTNSESALDSRHHSHVAREHAERGLKAFYDLLKSIEVVKSSQESIFSEVEKSHQGISEINGIINQIDEKTHVINDIVFQTKLLSFNASVEAARAGEHGQGFAVVAEEVGNLARMSGVAAQEITGLLSQSTSRVSGIIKETRESVGETIEKAATLLDSCIHSIRIFETVLTEITQDVNHVDLKVDAISIASREQDNAVTEISKVMQNLDRDTQKSALIAHHSAVSAQDLSAQSEELERLVIQMTKLLRGDKAARKGTRPAVIEQDGSFENDDHETDVKAA
ncbi:MAG TPA: methyl-accepting chemotaxis protein [Oligoflexus sp.]|uniref:methyl-accepting chemotaxis protein n=1 Tax=Oligoflexus sp. TaxID=1971216 RepID=UPI002D7FF756|nr:methyl-accepting chemotaxis protein [Oligoflexus sp.]HET9239702.1 methyl-accepting chemotaxis protein [Oligoflexus sp.]